MGRCEALTDASMTPRLLCQDRGNLLARPPPRTRMNSTSLPPAPPAAPSFGEALRFWLKLGCISFGGPAGQIALMHRELVTERRWLSERRFLHALNYCMVLPGPEAQQLATYLGWLLHRTWGGIAAGVLFVLPSLGLLVLLSWLYLRFGDTALLAGVFAGIKPAVVAIVLQAAHRLGSRTLRTPCLWATALGAFAGLALLNLPFPLILALAAASAWLGSRVAPAQWPLGQAHAASGAPHPPALIDDHTPPPPHARFAWSRLGRVLGVGALLWAVPMGALLAWVGGSHAYTQMAWFFTKAAWLTFGGAYAVLPYVVQGAVEQHGWLSAAQMIDGLALGETTPGPLIMVVAFVAYLGGYQLALLGPEHLALAGAMAAVLVTWFTFLPSFVLILAGGPLVEQTQRQLGWTAPLTAITAAVVGVILHLALFFGQHVLWPQGLGSAPDLQAVAITALAAWALMRHKLGVVPVIVGCALLGLALQWLTG